MSMRAMVSSGDPLPDTLYRRGRLAEAAALFRSLGDPTRLMLLARLARGEARVVDLTAELGLAQSTVSAHLACLRDCGLVDYRPHGRASMYSLAHPELLDLLAAAETLLGRTGHAVALCPRYGVDGGATAPGQPSSTTKRIVR